MPRPSSRALLLATLLIGCDGSPPGVQCDVDPALLAAEIECVADDHCPCGTHCDRGICAFECAEDADCDEGWCDGFGRCRAEGDDALVPAPEASGRARLTVEQPVLETVEGGVSTLRLQLDAATPSDLRVVADDGALVRCDESGSFVDECQLEAVEPDAEVTVAVRRSTAVEPTQVGRVTVHGPGGARVSTSVVPAGGAPAPSAEPIEPGVYRGEAVLVSVDGGAPSVVEVVPLVAELWDGVAMISDPTGRLAGEPIVGALDLTGMTLAIPARARVAGAGVAGMDPSVWEARDVAALSSAGGVVRFERTVSLGGLVAAAAPTEVWNVFLERAGEPSGAAAPAVPEDAPLEDAATVVARATPAEEELVRRTAVPAAARRADAWLDRARETDLCAPRAPGPDAAAVSRVRAGWWTAPAGADLAAIEAGDGGLFGALAGGLVAAGVSATEAATMSVTTSSVSGLATTALPCALSFAPTSVDGASCGALDVSPAAYDDCDAMRAALGCEVVDVSTGSVNVDATLQLTGSCGADTSVALSGVPTRVCVLPAVPRGCAEALSCAEGTSDSEVGSEALLGTGDALCASTDRALALSVDLRRASGAPPTVDEVFDGCLTALEATPAAGSLDALFGAEPCFEAYRVVLAIGAAARASSDPQEARVLGRLLGRWYELLTFLAHEALQREQVAAVFRETEEVARPADVLAALRGPLTLALHPVVATALWDLPPDALTAPDYRAALGLDGVPGDARVALPVRLQDAVAAVGSLLEHRLERASLERDPTGLDAAGELGPTLALLGHLAERLAGRAPDAEWSARYVGARERAVRIRRAVGSRAAAFVAGRNPLGIEDEDLPLYFFGDETGAGGRFSAVSDFLLGARPSDPAWAPFLVQSAQDALDDARRQYVVQSDRTYRAELSDAEAGTRRATIASDADAVLEDLCGATEASYVEDDAFQARDCHIAAACRPTALDWYTQRVGISNLAFQACISRRIKHVYGPGFGLRDDVQDMLARLDPTYGRLADEEDLDPPPSCVDPALAACDDGVCLSCRDGSVLALGFDTLHMNTPASSAALELGQTTDAFQTAVDECADGWGAARLAGPEPRFDGILPPPRLPTLAEATTCYRGSIGEAVLEIEGARQDLEAARSEIAEARDVYEAEVNECARRYDAEQEILGAIGSHRATITALTGAQLGVDVAAEWTGQLKDCLATVSGASWSRDLGASGFAAIGSCGAGAVQGAFNTASLSIQRDIDLADREFEQTLRALEADAAYEACLNDAARWLVNARTAAVRVTRAVTDVRLAYVRAENLIAQAHDTWGEARGRLADGGAGVRPPTFDLWLDEAVTTYARRFRLARRAVYLAVLAVEYEYQTSIAQKQAVLEAETPAELEAALSELWATAGTRSVNGARPNELRVVLSLRDQLLRIHDEAGDAPGERTLSASDRFRLLLSDPRFARYDDEGVYAGQLIPFALAPLGSDDDAATVPILAGSDCAERLWSVNASIVGGGSLVEGSDTTSARIELWKQNTFYSQWCAPRDDEPFQVASVRPSRNLFREPGVGAAVGMDRLGREPETFTKARIEAYFGVDRAALESEEYASGDTSELAARGLYGRYALFLPAEVLSRFEGGARTDGLVLDRVDDILLRLDYVSVAR